MEESLPRNSDEGDEVAYADIEGIEVTRQRGGFCDGDVPRGPQRWERARLNAIKNPQSKAAQLYRTRRAVATDIVQALDPDGAWSFEYAMLYEPGTTRQYLCSIECAAMHLQLERFQPSAIHAMLSGLVTHGHGSASRDWGRADVSCVLKRTTNPTAKCKTCGCHIKPTPAQTASSDRAATQAIEQADAAHVAATVDTDKYVLVNGNFEPLSSVRVVDLSLETLHLLTRYSTPELRAQYAANLGYPLSEEV